MQIYPLTIVNDILRYKAVTVMLSINTLSHISWMNSFNSCISIRHFEYSCVAGGYYLKKTTRQLICTDYIEGE